MAKAYTKQDIIGAFLFRFEQAGLDTTKLAKMADTFYDKVGKDTFRKYASVDADAMKVYFGSKR